MCFTFRAKEKFWILECSSDILKRTTRGMWAWVQIFSPGTNPKQHDLLTYCFGSILQKETTRASAVDRRRYQNCIFNPWKWVKGTSTRSFYVRNEGQGGCPCKPTFLLENKYSGNNVHQHANIFQITSNLLALFLYLTSEEERWTLIKPS